MKVFLFIPQIARYTSAMTSRFWRILARIAFILLLAYEFLHVIDVLDRPTSFTWMGLFITGAVVWGFLEILEWRSRRAQIDMPAWTWWAALFALGPDAAGDNFGWYQKFIWYDQLMHAVGSGMITAIAIAMIWVSEKARHLVMSTWTRWLFPFCVAITIGVLYEIEEFSEDYFGCDHRDLIPDMLEKTIRCGHRSGGMEDTINDMLFNILGSVSTILVAAVIWKWAKRRVGRVSPA